MTGCPHCGAPNPAGATFCPRCRKRTVAPSWSGRGGESVPDPSGEPEAPAPPREAPPRPGHGLPPRFTRPRAITLLAWTDFVTAAGLVAIGVLSVFGSTMNTGDDRALLSAMAVGMVLLAFAHFVAGLGLLGLNGWGRVAQIALAIVSLMGAPFGTVMGALQLAWFFKPGARTLFSGRRPQDLPEDEWRAAEEAGRETGIVTGAAVMGLVLVSCAGIGFGAAVAVPSMLVARISTNEAAAIADVRAVTAAEAAYRSANGHYDRVECLAVPSACIPGYPVTAPVFLQGALTASPRSGYSFHLEPGPSPTNLSLSRSSASSMDRFAYLALPQEFRSTGRRIFCTDDTGRVCAFTDLGARRIVGGRCSSDCQDLP